MTCRGVGIAAFTIMIAAGLCGIPVAFYPLLLLLLGLAGLRIWHHVQYSHYRRCLRDFERELCPRCRYPSQGLKQDVCPECGACGSNIAAESSAFVAFYQRQWFGEGA